MGGLPHVECERCRTSSAPPSTTPTPYASSGYTSLYEDELAVLATPPHTGRTVHQRLGNDLWTVGLTYTPPKSLLGHLRAAYDVYLRRILAEVRTQGDQ